MTKVLFTLFAAALITTTVSFAETKEEKVKSEETKTESTETSKSEAEAETTKAA